MLNQDYKIIYSLKFHIALQAQGFECIMEMKNPNNQKLNCWVYEKTAALQQAVDALIEGKERQHD